MATLPTTRRSAEIAEFIEKLKPAPGAHVTQTAGRGRLIFALDATASREPTWDRACAIQGEMFAATATLGGLDVQLAYYRGYNECKASHWMTSPANLHRTMRQVSCAGGQTQIERILTHAIDETGKRKVAALVFVGDAMEEKLDRLCRLAGELGRLGTPILLFHEAGEDPAAAATFRQLADLSHGACFSFDTTSAERLRALLGAVAVYATGGMMALTAYGEEKGGEVLRLTSQLRRRG